MSKADTKGLDPVDKDTQLRIYKYMTKELLDSINYNEIKTHINIFIDKSGHTNEQDFNVLIENCLSVLMPIKNSIYFKHVASGENKGLQAVDIILNAAYKKYEYNKKDLFNSIECIKIKEMEFIPEWPSGTHNAKFPCGLKTKNQSILNLQNKPWLTSLIIKI